MSFGFALLWSTMATVLTITIVPYWADKFKIDISGKAILLSAPILLVLITAYNMIAPEKLWTITFIVGLAIVVLTCAFHWIRLLIDKWKS